MQLDKILVNKSVGNIVEILKMQANYHKINLIFLKLSREVVLELDLPRI